MQNAPDLTHSLLEGTVAPAAEAWGLRFGGGAGPESGGCVCGVRTLRPQGSSPTVAGGQGCRRPHLLCVPMMEGQRTEVPMALL